LIFFLNFHLFSLQVTFYQLMGSLFSAMTSKLTKVRSPESQIMLKRAMYRTQCYCPVGFQNLFMSILKNYAGCNINLNGS